MERDYKVVTLSSELNVLIATALWLLRNGWTIEAMSIAVGHGLPSIDYQKGKIREALMGEKVETISFKAKGPDIVARSQEGIWRIECKGMGGESHKLTGTILTELWQASCHTLMIPLHV